MKRYTNPYNGQTDHRTLITDLAILTTTILALYLNGHRP